MISLCNKWSWEFDVNYGVVNLINPFQSHSSIASRFEPTFLFGFFGFLFFSVLMVLSCKQFIWRSCMNTTKKKQQQSIARSGCNHYTVFTRLLVYDSLRRFLGPTYLQKDGASLHQTRDFLLNSLGGIDSLTNRSTLRKLLMNFSRLGRFGRRLTFGCDFYGIVLKPFGIGCGLGADWVRWLRVRPSSKVSACVCVSMEATAPNLLRRPTVCHQLRGRPHRQFTLLANCRRCWSHTGASRCHRQFETPRHQTVTTSQSSKKELGTNLTVLCLTGVQFPSSEISGEGGGGGIIEKGRSDFTSSVVLSDG